MHLAVERERAGRLERLQRALLHDQRPQHAGHARAEQRLLAAQPAVRRAGAHQALRRGHQPAAGDDPLPQRRHASTTRSTRTAATSGSSTRTATRCRARPARTSSYLKYDIDVEPGQTVDALMDWRDVEHWNADDQPDPDADPGHHRPAARRHRHLVQREPLPRHEERAAHEHHVEQRVRRVLPHRPQPRARAGHQLRRDLRRHDDGLPHRPARRLPGEVRTTR